MGKQLSILGGDVTPALDHARTALAVKQEPPAPPARAPETAVQFDLVPIRRRANKDVDGATRMLQLAEDIAEYLNENPKLRRAIRSRRKKKECGPRSGREGDRPESLGSIPLTDEEVNEMRQDIAILDVLGVKLGPPKNLSQCPKSGPCGRVSCRHHNYLEVDGDFVKINFPHLEPQELKNPCSLRVAERAAKRKPIGPRGEVMSHSEASKLIGLTCERTRQIEDGALKQIKQERSDLR